MYLRKIRKYRNIILVIIPLFTTYLILRDITSRESDTNFEDSYIDDENEDIDGYDQEPRHSRYWINIGNYAFIKSSSVFYFLDISTITLSIVHDNRENFSPGFEIKLQNSDDSSTRKFRLNEENSDVSVTSYDLKNWPFDYAYKASIYVIKLKQQAFNNEDFYSLRNPKSAKLDVWNILTHNLQIARLKLKLKNSKNNQKPENSITVCTRAFYTQASNAKEMEIWLQLSDIIGLGKIYTYRTLYDGYFNESVNLAALSKRHLIFENTQMNKFPDFMYSNFDLNRAHKFSEFIPVNEQYFYDVFNFILQNECFNRHRDSFEYILMTSINEIALPRMNKNSNTEMQSLISSVSMDNILQAKKKLIQLECSIENPKNSLLINYLDKIDLLSSSRDGAFSIGIAYYLPDEIVYEIMTHLSKFVSENRDEIDKDPKDFFDGQTEFKWKDSFGSHRFTIENLNEYKYAYNLMKIYEEFIQPFFKIAKIKQIKINKYDSFFKLSNSSESQVPVVSLFNTDLHDAINLTLIETKQPNIDRNYVEISNFNSNKIKFPKRMSIKDLSFDVNYFNCFYLPSQSKVDSLKYDIWKNLIKGYL